MFTTALASPALARRLRSGVLDPSAMASAVAERAAEDAQRAAIQALARPEFAASRRNCVSVDRLAAHRDSTAPSSPGGVRPSSSTSLVGRLNGGDLHDHDHHRPAGDHLDRRRRRLRRRCSRSF
jgi:hypothetical protein